MEIRIKTRGCAVARLLGAAAAALALSIIICRLPYLMNRMAKGMMSEMMKGMEPGTMPDL